MLSIRGRFGGQRMNRGDEYPSSPTRAGVPRWALRTLLASSLMAGLLVLAGSGAPEATAASQVQSPSVASGTNWTSPGNVFGSDDARATYNNTAQNDLRISGFGFTVPSGSTISGITVRREGHGTAGNSSDRTFRIGLTKDGSTLAGTRKTGQLLPKNTDNTVSIGGPADAWGATWTPSEINSPI